MIKRIKYRYLTTLLSILTLLGCNEMSAEEKEAQRKEQLLKPFLIYADNMIGLKDVVIKVPLEYKDIWVPGNYFDGTTDVIGMDWKDGRRLFVGFALRYPEFEPITEETKMEFRNVDYPQKQLSIIIESKYGNLENHKYPYEKILTGKLNNVYLDEDWHERYTGEISAILAAEDAPLLPSEKIDMSGISQAEKARIKKKDIKLFTILNLWTELEDKYGLKRIGERFSIERRDGKYYHYQSHKVKSNPNIIYDDDVYYSYGKDGEVARIITCTSDADHQDRLVRNKGRAEKYCTHEFLYPPLAAIIRLHYHYVALSQWQFIEDKVKLLLNSFLEKPKDKEIINSNDYTKILERNKKDN